MSRTVPPLLKTAAQTAVLTAAVLAAGCSSKNPGAYETATATASASKSADEIAALVAKADQLWEGRIDTDTLREAIAAYEAVIEADPTHKHALTRVTRAWYFLADGHLTDKDAKVETWGKAIAWGKKCLAMNEAFAERINAGEKEKDAVEVATKADVPCLYWTASAIGKWGKAQGIAKALGNLPTVKAYIGRAEALDPEFYYYGPARYWGAYYSVLPSFAGQDLELSAQYFEASVAGAPEYLATRGLRAENLAVKSQDVGLFMTDLQAILDFDVSTAPDIEPENTMEQTKAQALLDKRAELFSKSAIEAYDASAAE